MLRTSPPVPARPLLGPLVAFSLLTAAGGWALLRSQHDRLVRLQLDQLVAVAEVQARLVVNWRRERLGDVRTAVSGLGPSPLDAIEAEGAARRHAIDHFAALARHYGYRRAQLFDATGRLLLAVDGNGIARPEPLAGDLLQSVLAAPAGVRVTAATVGDRPRFVVLGRSGGGEGGVAIVALTVDAGAALFPALSPWPVRSSTGASFLAEPFAGGFRAILPDRRSGIRRSLTPEPGAATLAGPAGARALPMRTEDGREVFVALRPIEEAGWWLAASLDRTELGEAVLAAALRIGIGCALLLSTLWASALVLWNRARLRAARGEQQRAAELRALVDHAPDAIVLFDGEGRVLEANRAMCDFFGLPRDELLGRAVESLVGAESLARQPSRLAEVRAGERVVVERTLRAADGREAPWEISAGRLPDGRLVAFARDVTVRHALERRTRLLSRALEESPSPALITDPTGVIEYVNRSYSEATGHARAELLGTRPRFLDAEAGADSSAGILREAKAGREWSGERVDRRRNGEIFFWSLRVHPIVDEAGRVEHLLVVGEDVSERRRLAERFRLAHRIVRMGVWEWDFSRRELWWSEECYELYGVDRASFRPDEGILTLVHPDDRPAVERAFRRALEGGPPFELEFRIRPGGAGERRLRAVAALLRDDAGLPLAAIGVVLDVSERHAAERALEETREQLHHAQKMEALGRLAGGVAHDFNNLLGVVLGYAELLESALPASQGGHELGEIRRAAERAAELTRQLLAIGRRQALELRAVDLRAMLDETEPLLRRALPERITLALDIAAGLEPVQADPSMLLQVVLDLALNARDAMPGGGRLALTARAAELDAESAAQAGLEPGRYVRLEVADTGEGMPPEVLERAFEPFFTTRAGQGGSGLGLATVYGIVRQLGGDVELRSEPGAGTTASVLLPVAGAAGHARAAAPEPPAPARPTRVLVVEDVAPLGEMIERMLEAGGHQVSVVETPEEALALAARPGFELDLLLTDLVLPGIDGRELAERLRARLPGLKVVLMSGYSDLLAEASGPGDLGADAVLPKPFTRGRLEEVLAAVLAGRDAPEAPR
jgi:PAS domain S-box-containing protein